MAAESLEEVWLNKRKCRSGEIAWELGLGPTTALRL